jgi:hypothetical protein
MLVSDLQLHEDAEALYVGDHIYGDILRSKKVRRMKCMLVLLQLQSFVP